MDMMDKDMDIGHRHVNWSILGSDMPSALGLVYTYFFIFLKSISPQLGHKTTSPLTHI